MPDSPYQLPRPQLQWDDDGSPRSGEFDDVYFSRAGGADETDYVFLQQNRLETRWRALDPNHPGLFTLAETGFGTGLNFLAAWNLWRNTAPPGWRLLFLSAECLPLDRNDLIRALAQWPEYRGLAEPLIAAWPPRLPGFHRRDVGGGVSLQLLYGDAADTFAALRDSRADAVPAGFAVDAWFLDGFAPAKNPGMWSEPLFATIGRLSRPGTTFATFTAAGAVRRGLRDAGFAVEKVAGFGAKREMLRGDWCGPNALDDNGPTSAIDYWAAPRPPEQTATSTQAEVQTVEEAGFPPAQASPSPPTLRKHQPVIAVIGGGLAGTHTARALAERGRQVVLLERETTLAAGASGNPQGVLYTRLSPQVATLSRFALASYQHAIAHYRQRFRQGELQAGDGDLCGVLQLTQTESEWAKLRDAFDGHGEWVRFLEAEQASALAGCTVTAGALWLPHAGWLAPVRICARNTDHPSIDVRLDCAVKELEQTGQGWRLHTAHGDIGAAAVVIATAHDSHRLPPTAALPLKPIRGQITRLPEHLLDEKPRCVICHDGYLAPAADGITCGATFDLHDGETAMRAADHRRNLEQQAAALPRLLAQPPTRIDTATLDGRVGFRATTPDYLPLVGGVPDISQLRGQYAPLARNAKANVSVNRSWLPNLYVNIGHGSRGLTSTPIAAELLAALICGEARPLPLALVQALSPARFAIRDLIRGR